MNSIGASQCLSTRLGDSDETYFPGVDQFGHRADRVLDRNGRVDAVQIKQIDMIGTQTGKAGIT